MKLIDWLTVVAVCWGFTIITIAACLSVFDDNMQNKGIAVSEFLSYYHGIELEPERAMWINPVVTTTDITIEDMDVFTD